MNQLILTPLNLGSVKKGTEQAPYIISSLFKDLVSNKIRDGIIKIKTPSIAGYNRKLLAVED